MAPLLPIPFFQRTALLILVLLTITYVTEIIEARPQNFHQKRSLSKIKSYSGGLDMLKNKNEISPDFIGHSPSFGNEADPIFHLELEHRSDSVPKNSKNLEPLLTQPESIPVGYYADASDHEFPTRPRVLGGLTRLFNDPFRPTAAELGFSPRPASPGSSAKVAELFSYKFPPFASEDAISEGPSSKGKISKNSFDEAIPIKPEFKYRPVRGITASVIADRIQNLGGENSKQNLLRYFQGTPKSESEQVTRIPKIKEPSSSRTSSRNGNNDS